MKTSPKKTKDKKQGSLIYAYGFDKAGFATPDGAIEVENGNTIEFLPFDSTVRLDEADGVIVPHGIFEHIEWQKSYGGGYYKVSVHKDELLERERQVHNLVDDRKWVCFLLGCVVDSVPKGHYEQRDISDTDLSKKFLNGLNIQRESCPDGAHVSETNTTEFDSYLRLFGVAKTLLLPPSNNTWRSIAHTGRHHFALECLQSVFFLPFHSANKESSVSEQVCRIVVEAITKYREAHREEIPDWAQAFEFASESSLNIRRDALLSDLNTMESELRKWNSYKSILATTGDVLKERLVGILTDYLGLTIDPLDEHKEDAKILDDKGVVLALCEFKGVSSGVKREHINQVDSFRERSELQTTTSGLLIINCERDIKDIGERFKAAVTKDQVKYARNNNVLVIRTIDLLFLMKQLDGKSVPERKEMFLRFLSAGGGWLKVDADKCELMKE